MTRLKLFAHWVAVLVVSPSLISWHVRSLVMGPDRAIEGSTQFWAIVPGLIGQYLRRAFLCHTLSFCARSATIEFGTLFSSASASIGERAYIGPRCHLGWAVIEARRAGRGRRPHPERRPHAWHGRPVRRHARSTIQQESRPHRRRRMDRQCRGRHGGCRQRCRGRRWRGGDQTDRGPGDRRRRTCARVARARRAAAPA